MSTHRLRAQFGPRGLRYRIICPFDTQEIPDGPDRPRCRPTGEGEILPCLAIAHLQRNGIQHTWIGPDIEIAHLDTPIEVTWGTDGYARLAPGVLADPTEVDPQRIAEALALASNGMRYRVEDGWKVLLEQAHHVEVAFNKAMARASHDQESQLRQQRDFLLAHIAQSESTTTRHTA